MAQFKRNHRGSKRKGMNYQRMLVYVFVLAMGLVYLGNSIKDFFPTESDELPYVPKESTAGERYFLPTNPNGIIVSHDYYSLSYVEEFEQAEWVAYELTRSQLEGPRSPRERNFTQDPLVRSGSSHSKDYTRSGYTRGHLVPAADRSFSPESMKETFFTSNISPQKSAFNGGIWRELEELTRDWARKYGHIFVVSGPILEDITSQIGNSEVAVPNAFFKVILDLQSADQKAIAFVIPNELSTERLSEYALTIDEVEIVTGIDFFADLLDKGKESELESNIDISLWPFNEKKYNKRLRQWNKQ